MNPLRPALKCLIGVSACLLPAAIASPVETPPWTVTIDALSGNYTVVDTTTGWKLDGSLDRSVGSPKTVSGTDKLGAYTGITFDWHEDGPLSAEIRIYPDRSAVLFKEICRSARAKPPAAFPVFAIPENLHRFGYRDAVFSPPSFKGGGGPSPWLLFDDSAHSVIVSPAANFVTAELKLNQSKELASQLNSKLENLPDGFTHQTLLVEADSIHQACDVWGHAMTDLAGKVRPANDSKPELSKLGYWTDNGSAYYYKYDPARGYAGTLLDVSSAYHKLNIPLAYLQLDSWWYIKTSTGANGKPGPVNKNSKLPAGTWNCYGGLTEYTAHPFLFPNGLAAFQHDLGLPLITHNRWIDVNSPYRKKYKISGVAAIDPRWWDDIMDYLKGSGVIVYEQDWLNIIIDNSPEFQSTTTAGDAFLDNMARSARERGIDLQYCMETPHDYMQGSRYDNLTTVRVSEDRFERSKWTPALYVSHLATSLGEWPWVDTFHSSETPNMILATLSAGMVGVGDFMDQIDTANIASCIRADGVIVKPDTSIVPLDRTYLSDATDQKAPMIAAAYTDHGPHRTAYVFCYPRSEAQKQIEFKPSDLGIASDVWVYEPSTGHGQLVSATGTFTAAFAEHSIKKAYFYFVVSPVDSSGIALIGDAGKIATAGRQRISAMEDKANGVTATVTFAAGEKSVTLCGYAVVSPVVSVTGGTADAVKYDTASHQFTVAIAPAEGSAIVSVKISK
jgi:hypothetical protein